MARENRIPVRLSDDELAQLDEQRPPGMARSVYLRSLLHRPPEVKDVASREGSLAILTAMARDGKQGAAIALAKELAASAPADASDHDPLEELLKQ